MMLSSALLALAAIASQASALGTGGFKSNGASDHPSLSADGRYLTFASRATNLSPDDADANRDVYVRDLETGTTILVSRATGATGVKANGESFNPTISGDGRYVAFASDANNLSPSDTDTNIDVYVRDLVTGTTSLVSRASGAAGADSNGPSTRPSISSDGRYIAFASLATNLSADDVDAFYDVYVRDLQADTTTLVSRATGSFGADANNNSDHPSISGDGRYVAFASYANNLSPADSDSLVDAYVRDLQTNTTSVISLANGVSGAKGNGSSLGAEISADGRYVAFVSNATNLSPDDTDTHYDIYLRDLQVSTTTLVSRASSVSGTNSNDEANWPSISSDGRFVGFASLSTNLSPDDTDADNDAYFRGLQTSTTTLVSRASGAAGAKGNMPLLDCQPPYDGCPSSMVSPDGRYVAFASLATNLSPDDPDSTSDLYVRDLGASTTSLESRATPGYVRPRGATPLRASLVPAYQPCAAPNSAHGAPLSFGSCSPPAPASENLTIGTPDANGAAANFIGSVLLRAVGTPGGPDSDMSVLMSLSDFRCAGTVATCGSTNTAAGRDYTGEVQLALGVRLTDKAIAPQWAGASESGTTEDFSFTADGSCAGTASTTIGSNCLLSTSADALVPGSVIGGKRSIWALGELKINDGGQDGIAATSPNSTFAVQGVFVP
jgi:Tol biopolymer transport system component